MKTVREEPMPIKYTLMGLDKLLTPDYLPGLSNLEARRTVLTRALESYCATLLAEGSVSNCDAPKPDPDYWCMDGSWTGDLGNTDNCAGFATNYSEVSTSPEVSVFECPWREPLRGLAFTHPCNEGKVYYERLDLKCATYPTEEMRYKKRVIDMHAQRQDGPWVTAYRTFPNWNQIHCPAGYVAAGIRTGHPCHHDSNNDRGWNLLCYQLNTEVGYWLDLDSSRRTQSLKKLACGGQEARLSCDGPNEVITAVEFGHRWGEGNSFDESFRLTCTTVRAPFLGCPALELGTVQLV